MKIEFTDEQLSLVKDILSEYAEMCYQEMFDYKRVAVEAEEQFVKDEYNALADQEERDALEENAALLAELGFVLEPYGADDVIVRAVPDELDPAQTVAALEEICEKLKSGARDLARDGILQTISCKSAIKAGWDTDPAELQVLADKVASGEIKYCPHGRPVAVVLTKKELDKQFSRIV